MLFPSLIFMVSCLHAVSAIWPLPVEWEHGSSVLWLSPDFEAVYKNQAPTPVASLPLLTYLLPRSWRWHWRNNDCSFDFDQSTEKILGAAIERTREDLLSHSFVPWKFHGKETAFEPGVSNDRKFIHRVEFVQEEPSATDKTSNESYTLTVEHETVVIKFVHLLGALRALPTLTQLFYKHSKPGVGVYTVQAPVTIKDAPAFGHRGLNLDISRNIVTPQTVMRTIDALAFNKFNRLHLHASDAQSWPLEIPALPELAIKGAFHKDQIWTVMELEIVQSYGFMRGIEVYIEIDMPGHTASVHAAFPDLIASFNRQPWQNFSAQPGAGQLKLGNAGVVDFITTLLSDLLPRTAPFTNLFHLGGDEMYASCYDMCPEETKPYLQAFVDHAISRVQVHGLRPVVWEEHLLDFNLTLPSNVVVQTWRPGSKDKRSALAEVISRGHQALFGPHTHWYLDCGHGTWLDPDLKNLNGSPIRSPYLDYCAPYKNWREVYSYNPLEDVPLRQHNLVLGGEVHMWGELTDDASLENSLWPRVAAAGAVLWEGTRKEKMSEDVTRRLAAMREWLLAKGVAAGPVANTWCLMNPGNCQL